MSKPWVPDVITLPPTIMGSFGRAWLCDHATFIARHAADPRASADAVLAHWLIEAPWAHPAWHSYSLILVHLRPIPDNRPTVFYLPGASHEMWLYALDPDSPREPMIRGRAPPAWINPCNFSAQILEPADSEARVRIEDAVRRICAGTLSPDTDFIRTWMHMFGDNMILGDKKRAGETRLITTSGEIRIPPKPGPQDLN